MFLAIAAILVTCIYSDNIKVIFYYPDYYKIGKNVSVCSFKLVMKRTLFQLKFDHIFSVCKKRDKYIFQKLITLMGVV